MHFCLTKNDAVNDKSDDEEDKTLDADDDDEKLFKKNIQVQPRQTIGKTVGF